MTALPFAGFYLLVCISEKSFKKIYNDVIFFTIPFFGWMLLILFNYEDGTVFDYIQSQLDLILKVVYENITSQFFLKNQSKLIFHLYMQSPLNNL